jgi:alpha-D-xyloside xylohydrolase
MDFMEDNIAICQPFEYMFGKSILVAPITEPNVTEWDVYLPRSAGWYNFWTGELLSGGQTIKTEAPLDRIPLFVKAGSILPFGELIQYTGEKPEDILEIRIYRGTDAQFDLYEDEGDNYNYEKGEYTIIPFNWDEKNQSLTIGSRQGKYLDYPDKRIFNIVLVNESQGKGASVFTIKNQISYTGKVTKIDFN